MSATADRPTARLSGKVAIVTGAARGIGASITRRFAEEGAVVLATDIRDPEGEQMVKALAGPARVTYANLDVTSEAHWARAVKVCCDEFGLPTILVNNAGITRVTSLEDETLEGWQRVIDVDLTGAFLGMRAVIPLMRRAKGGSIINMSSIAGLVGSGDPSPAAYHAAKGGLTALTLSAAVSYAKDGIRVNSIHPGLVQTDMVEEAGSAPYVLPRTPLGRAAAPEEIASAAVYLASEEASFVTGMQLRIDGGYTAQ